MAQVQVFNASERVVIVCEHALYPGEWREVDDSIVAQVNGRYGEGTLVVRGAAGDIASSDGDAAEGDASSDGDAAPKRGRKS